MLQVDHVEARYRQRPVLHGVSLEVSPGEVVLLIGPNGAGKSTLLKVVAGLLPATSGAIRWAGEDLERVPTHERKRLGLGYALQGGRIFQSLTVEENLRLAAMGSGSRVHDTVDKAAVAWPDVWSQRQVRAGQLSGGQQQLLSILLAAVGSPGLLLLDEPSKGLSPIMTDKVLEYIRDLSVEGRAGVLLVEQRVKEAVPVSDEVIVLRDGAVVSRCRAGDDDLLHKVEQAYFASARQ